MSAWTRKDTAELAETAMKAGLTPEDAPTAMEVGAWVLAHRLTPSDLSGMILGHLHRAVLAEAGSGEAWDLPLDLPDESAQPVLGFTPGQTSLAIGEGAFAEEGDIVIGENLLTIHPDGTVEGRLEDMGEAARVLGVFVRTQVSERGDYNEGLEEGIKIGRTEERARILRVVDASPAVLWAGQGGAKERIERLPDTP